ncbi:hypothetical protein BFW38_09250 [Terasakiispira papahanaumokuakeensis]|uniref:DUF2937 domain-containing protein n=1 Tax=Terasakiispira papahanaumokuakeensis TaxID=197479 RepID=A0A1E2V9L4_9GAMM|nr:DUF2937 family protein [Terasakiispira papahanaumokuakeensis]ODC03700.1 hypothetical protein BFW38_09250 [Terasakiispira papahanaumokuakeensis]
MRWGNAVGLMLAGFIDRVLVVLGAVLGAQWPGFLEAYRQRLGGHLDESRRWLNSYRQLTEQFSEQGLSGFIDSLERSQMPVLRAQGQLLQQELNREAHLEQAWNGLSDPSTFLSSWHFIKTLDVHIAKRTLEIYSPTLPLTIDALIWALLVAVLVWGFWALLWWGVKGGCRGGMTLWQRVWKQASSGSTPPSH